MRHKISFTAQVFSVVIMFFSIFVGTLQRDKNREADVRVESAQSDMPDAPARKSSLFAPITNLLPTITAWY